MSVESPQNKVCSRRDMLQMLLGGVVLCGIEVFTGACTANNSPTNKKQQFPQSDNLTIPGCSPKEIDTRHQLILDQTQKTSNYVNDAKNDGLNKEEIAQITKQVKETQGLIEQDLNCPTDANSQQISEIRNGINNLLNTLEDRKR